MKKRILSILLCLCMAACMLPTVAFAADTGKAIQLGTDALSKNVNTATAPTVYFGQNQDNNPAAWRVIGYDGNGVASVQEDMTLLAAVSMGEAVFDNDCVSIEYAPSDLKTAIDALAGKLTTKENAAVKKRTLTSGSYNGENTDCVAGGQVDNAVFWPLSSKEAIAVNEDLRVVDPEHPTWATSNWWLRSPGSQAYDVAVVEPDGSVHYSGYTIRIYRTRGVRPAFNLNLNSVLFTSAAVGGKPDGGLTPISEYAGNEWKLTLKDSNRNFAVTETTVSGDPGDTVTLHYTGATAGINEYISVILADNSGAQYYGRVAQPTEATGTVEIKIPSDIAPGSYTLKVFSELYNGDYKTDYASNFTDITLTVEKQADEQFTLTPGGRYYFDLSAMNIPGTVNSNLSDSTLHYVPFTYTGTVYAYSLSSNSSGVARSSQAASTAASSSAQYGYARDHSLFIADYAVTHSVSWLDLNAASLIFGKDYASGNISYALRAPSVGSKHKSANDADEHGDPENNEWDAILNKARQDWQDNTTGYIKNWKDMYSTGQDTAESPSTGTSQRMKRGYTSVRCLNHSNAGTPFPYDGFRPVLEVLHADTLGSDALKTVVLDLNGGSIGDATGTVNIVVKNGESFTAPSGEGLTRPNGNTDSYFWWLGSDGESYVPGAMIPAGVTSLTAQWTALTYSVTLHENGGTISSGNVTSYNYGEGATLPTAGDMTREGYTFAGWYDNEVLTGNPITEISTDETGNRTYWAKWTVNQYTITYDLAGGTAEGNLDTYTIETGAFTLKNPTRPGYTFTGWSGTGLTGEDNLTVTIPKGSTGNRSYTAHWRYNGGGGGSSYSYYTIKATAGAGGSISPSGNVSVREGRDQTFTITPDKDYAVANVKIDGKSIGAVKSYTFDNVRRTHTIEVIFMKANGNPQTGVFVDVATGSYYEDAVDWAVENGITKGTDNTHFSPDGICTRAQAATFLWRAAGSPKPETRTMPFTDVPAGSYYYDAVLWAVENGITKGTSNTTFSPNMTCTRAQIVTFLWRSEKSPAAGTANLFVDVKSTVYYADAVLWAVKEDITKGTTNTTFSPDADCTRAQIVTFLWRCKK
ncbi:MAG: S-layer homology domain-containing protein [Butyricicoccus sp.]